MLNAMEFSYEVQAIREMGLVIRSTVLLFVVHYMIAGDERRADLGQSIQFGEREGFSARGSVDLGDRKNAGNGIGG